LNEKYKGREDEEEDVRSCWMTFKGKRRHWKLKEEALARTLWRLAVEEAMDVS
jgi:hypothetical protein